MLGSAVRRKPPEITKTNKISLIKILDHAIISSSTIVVSSILLKSLVYSNHDYEYKKIEKGGYYMQENPAACAY